MESAKCFDVNVGKMTFKNTPRPRWIWAHDVYLQEQQCWLDLYSCWCTVYTIGDLSPGLEGLDLRDIDIAETHACIYQRFSTLLYNHDGVRRRIKQASIGYSLISCDIDSKKATQAAYSQHALGAQRKPGLMTV